MAAPGLAWQRLRWARETHGRYPKAEAFAKAINESGHNYRAHERDPDGQSKHIDIDFDKAVAWADVLDVRWEWLLNGRGVPWRDAAPPAQRVREALTGLMPADEVEQIASLTEMLDRKRSAG